MAGDPGPVPGSDNSDNSLANNLCRFVGMSMQGDGSRCIAGGAEIDPRGCPPFVVGKPILCLALCLTLCLLAAGCGSIGQTLGRSAQARDVSIAFESIDGLPRDISQRLVRDLNEEAAALRIAVVPAGGEASYRMRGYLAAHAEGSTTSITWAWDIYDPELHRAFRLSGEERAGSTAGRGPAGKNPAGRDPEGRNWATADEALLRRIARAGMEQLADFMASAPSPAAPAPPAPERSGSVVASRDDFRSEATGSFRSKPAAALDPVAVPLPHLRPAVASSTSTARLADAASGR
jgi:hypothetical protein